MESVVHKFRLYDLGSSKCCTTECRLTPSAQCSPHNQPCCNTTCSYHPADHVCLPGDPLQCKASSYCTGNSGECPSAPAIPNGSPCIEEGECQDGVCLPYCERQSIAKKSCICEEGTSEITMRESLGKGP
ncbi:hypothetical protein GCK32_021290 [Trichostrongylus colubriformis]|uniref:Disintegrin domain-containing protein n=1 Tax=Trichostrongylus colubriformis TaxID=6319 RepID=A0AAN8IDM7_TRICO